MKNIQKSMKFSFIYGFIGALIIPVFYEVYSNVSVNIGLFFIACFAVVSGIAFSRLPLRSGILGITVALAYTGIFGMLVYVLLHPAVVSFLNSNSVYFQLSLKAQVVFLLYTSLILFGMYIVFFVSKIFSKAIKQFKNNREKAGVYIQKAFSDNEDSK